jgi:cell wall-associated NlpC family hydrolase
MQIGDASTLRRPRAVRAVPLAVISHTAPMHRLIGCCALAAALLAGCGGSAPTRDAAHKTAAAQPDGLPPLPTTLRPKVVEPVAGGGVSAAQAPTRDPGLDNAGPAPTGAATEGTPRAPGGAIGGRVSVTRASALPNGVAVPPLEAPESVKQIIEAGNIIARSPYVWGGGHGKWLDTGYDCSGSVSFALAAAGLLDGPLDSGHLAQWGDPGPGRWVTIYANAGHVFMEVAGIRFDTVARAVTGSRWANGGRSTAGFAVRHPPGL